VLQALAVQRRATGCRPDQEAACATVSRGPGEVSNPLETEHRIEDVEGDHRDPVVGVRRCRGNPRRERARLVDALLEDLTVLVLAIEHEVLGVFRRVELPHLREDPELAEHALHAESA
jgi:hypothetical protein